VKEEFFLHLPRKMEPIKGSETLAFKPQTPGKYPKENILNLLCLTAIYKLLLIVNILTGEVKLVKSSLRLIVDTFYALSLWCHNTWWEPQKTRISVRCA
jgi:antibiotic biosynthesis monooxygenase (ABM) superfamily enzyme